MSPVFFTTPLEFRKWLQKNHLSQNEIVVGFYKVAANKKTMTWSQSVDEALCFGWIDGVRKSIDDFSYQIRFTPRKPNSIWSAVNINKFETLLIEGKMQKAGLDIYALRKEQNSKVYSFENEEVLFTIEFEKTFKANIKAWNYFQSLAPSYRKPSSNWVMSAKQESTKLKRLMELIADSAAETNKWKHNKYKKK